MSTVGQTLNKVRSVSLLDNRNWPVKRDGFYLTWWVEITGNKSPARGGSVDNPFDVSFTPCFSRIDGPVKEILILRAFDRFSVLRQAANRYFSEKPHVSWMSMGMEIRSSRIIHQHTARRLCHSRRRNTWHTRGFRDRYALCLGKNIHEDGTRHLYVPIGERQIRGVVIVVRMIRKQCVSSYASNAQDIMFLLKRKIYVIFNMRSMYPNMWTLKIKWKLNNRMEIDFWI